MPPTICSCAIFVQRQGHALWRFFSPGAPGGIGCHRYNGKRPWATADSDVRKKRLSNGDMTFGWCDGWRASGALRVFVRVSAVTQEPVVEDVLFLLLAGLLYRCLTGGIGWKPACTTESRYRTAHRSSNGVPVNKHLPTQSTIRTIFFTNEAFSFAICVV